jgi:hypothetical protein
MRVKRNQSLEIVGRADINRSRVGEAKAISAVRAEIAATIHDTVAQSVAALILTLDLLEKASTEQVPPQSLEWIHASAELARQCATEIRSLSSGLGQRIAQVHDKAGGRCVQSVFRVAAGTGKRGPAASLPVCGEGSFLRNVLEREAAS